MDQSNTTAMMVSLKSLHGLMLHQKLDCANKNSVLSTLEPSLDYRDFLIFVWHMPDL